MLKETNRYFLVFYSGLCTDYSSTIGCCDFTTNGYYLNSKKTIELLMKNQKKETKSIIITNIVELSESDFNDWKADISSTDP